MLKKLKIMQSVFAPYIICQAFTLLALFLLSSVIYAQTTIKTEIRVLPEGMLKEISEIETPARHRFEPEMVRIPAGSFTMGKDNNDDFSYDPSEPPHEVTFDYNFEVSKYEISRGEFQNFFDDPNTENEISAYEDPICQGTGAGNGIRWNNVTYGQTEQTDDHPVVCVSWDDAQAYISWLNTLTGKTYRLLSESEWEYVARAGVSKQYSIGEEGSDDITTNDANYGRSTGPTVLVNSYEPNNFGLHNVHGNVGEWVQDCWHWGYRLLQFGNTNEYEIATTDTNAIFAPRDGSAWETACQTAIFGTSLSQFVGLTDFSGFRTYRGESFNSSAERLTLTYRAAPPTDGQFPPDSSRANGNGVTSRSSLIGFRLARTIPDSEPIPPPKLTSPPSGTAINIQSTSTEVNLVIESLGATTILLALADGGELVVNPPPSQIELAPHIKKTSFTLTAVGSGSTTLILTISDRSENPAQTRNIQVNGPAAPELTSPQSGTAINIPSTSTEVNLVIESLGATTISLALADGGELVVNPPSSPIKLAANMKEASFTLTAVGGGSTTLTLTVRDSSGKTDTRDIQVNGPSIYPEMVKVPRGTFTIGRPRGESGSSAERPTRSVTIGYSFAVGKFELTQAQYGAFAAATTNVNNKWDTGDPNHPAASINVSDVETYISWLNRMTGQKYRLLSESEWEYAARAGTETAYSTGSNSITTQTANYNNSSGAVEVGGYAANAWGLHDVHGNVSEWVADCWHDNYGYPRREPYPLTAPTDGSVWDINCDNPMNNVYRSGSFNEKRAIGIRSAIRITQIKTNRKNFLGVRIARTLEASDPNSP